MMYDGHDDDSSSICNVQTSPNKSSEVNKVFLKILHGLLGYHLIFISLNYTAVQITNTI